MADQQRIEGLKSDFKCFNENGDDYVTKEEFVKFFTQYCGLSEGQASDKADMIIEKIDDKDKDGKISTKEFEEKGDVWVKILFGEETS